MTKCPIAMDKMANGTQLLNECEAKLHLTMNNWIQGDLEKC